MKKEKSLILAPALNHLMWYLESRCIHASRIHGGIFLKMSFPCPGDKFLTFYVNLLLCTDCSFRPSWKWVGGFCDSLVILTPHTVHVHFSTSFLCLHNIGLGLSPGGRTRFLVPKKCCLPLYSLQSHPNPLPPELLVVLVPIYKKLIIPLIPNLILLMGSIVNVSLTIHP